jgi:hypothetical protein
LLVRSFPHRVGRHARAVVKLQGTDDIPGTVVAGAGETTKGLTPPLSISVAPSGMVPMPVDDVPDAPGVATPAAEPAAAELVMPQPPDVPMPVVPSPDVLIPVVPSPDVPMPDELEPLVPTLLTPASNSVEPAEDNPVDTVEQAEPASGPGDGLKPPTLSWVAPIGIPIGPDEEFEVIPGVPSGDVTRSPEPALMLPPGIVVVICADATPQPSTNTPIAITARIPTPFASCCSFL